MRVLLGALGAAVFAMSPASGHKLRPLAHAYPGGGYTGDVVVHKGFAYLSSWHGTNCPAQGVRVYDVTTPSAPKLRSPVRTGPGRSHEMWLQTIRNRAYVYPAIPLAEFAER